MPYIAMCPSTVCSISKECERSWDSNIHEPDRDPKEQLWVPMEFYGAVGFGKNQDPSRCPYFMKVKKQPRGENEQN